MFDHIFGWRWIVIAQVVNCTRVWLGNGGGKHLSDVVHMNAAEHLVFLYDPPRSPVAYFREGAAPGTIDASDAENMER